MLTPREQQVLEQISKGRSDKEIANRLGCAVRTIVVHGQNIRYKLHALNRAHIVTKAFEAGLLTLKAVIIVSVVLMSKEEMRARRPLRVRLRDGIEIVL